MGIGASCCRARTQDPSTSLGGPAPPRVLRGSDARMPATRLAPPVSACQSEPVWLARGFNCKSWYETTQVGGIDVRRCELCGAYPCHVASRVPTALAFASATWQGNSTRSI